MTESRTCEESGKICYSAREAGRIINHAKSHHHRSDHLGQAKDYPRRKYWCSACHSYHLTKSANFYTGNSFNGKWEDAFYREYEKRQKA